MSQKQFQTIRQWYTQIQEEKDLQTLLASIQQQCPEIKSWNDLNTAVAQPSSQRRIQTAFYRALGNLKKPN